MVTDLLLALIAVEGAYLCAMVPNNALGRRSPVSRLMYEYERRKDRRKGWD